MIDESCSSTYWAGFYFPVLTEVFGHKITNITAFGLTAYLVFYSCWPRGHQSDHSLIRFPSEVHLVSVVLLKENQIAYLKFVGGSLMLVVSFLVSPHPLQHFSHSGKSDLWLLNPLSQCAITLVWFNTFISFCAGNGGSLLYRRVQGASPVDVWGQHLYTNKIWFRTWSHATVSSWHNFLMEAFRNLLKFYIFPFDLCVRACKMLFNIKFLTHIG